MFTDEAEIYTKAGNGGNGAVSFRHEKYIEKGGPDGGDGGRGGNVYIEAEARLHDLSLFNRRKRFLAENGENGGGKKMSGKNGEDLILKVPIGTVVMEKGKPLFELVNDSDKKMLLKGGNGGWGNQHFATSIKRAPRWAKEGLRGESKKISLVFKTIADVGLIGLPNAGKSTLLSVLTSAKPKIADYPFTTLEPNLGTYSDKESRIIIADIPGLIEGASTGKGLGDRFLRHIERTKLIVHLISADSDTVLDDYNSIRNELKLFSKKLIQKKEIVVLSKIDAVDEGKLQKDITLLKKKKITPLPISAATREGVSRLIGEIKRILAAK